MDSNPFLEGLSAPLKDRLTWAGKTQGWWTSPKMVVAVSGGGDSVALALLLKRFWPGEQVWGHVDHGIRETSGRDADFVSALAESWGIRCHVGRFHVPTDRIKGESMEMAARRVRHAFLEDLASRLGAGFIATAHTVDDQAETVMLNLLRGTGLWGLAGIPQRRGPWVRPVIAMRRWELRRYLEESSVPWVEDETNLCCDYRRNQVRLELIPQVERAFNPRFSERLFFLSLESAARRRQVEERRGAILPWLKRRLHPAPVCWDRKRASAVRGDDLLEALRAQGEELGLSSLDRIRIQEMVRKIRDKGPFRCPWKGGWWVVGDRAVVAFLREPLEVMDRRQVDLAPLVSGRVERVSVPWGDWDVTFKMGAFDAQSLVTMGHRGFPLMLDPSSPRAILESAGEDAPLVPGPIRGLIPKALTSLGTFAPGLESHCPPGRCVIIAKVFLKPTSRGDTCEVRDRFHPGSGGSDKG